MLFIYTATCQLDAYYTSILIIAVSLLPILISVYLRPRTPRRPKGCRRLGLDPAQSNLLDEYDPRYSLRVPEGHDSNGRAAWRIKSLFTYPIKSCGGVELDTTDVVPTGLAYDRQFCFAEYVVPKFDTDAKPHWTARTLRDRRFNRMTLVRPEIWVPDMTADGYAAELEEVKSQGVMVISYPRVVPNRRVVALLLKIGMVLGVIARENSFRVPLYPPPDRTASYPSVPVKIWKDSPVAYDYGQHLPQSLHDYLGSGSSTQLTLFRVDPSHHREIFRCAPRKDDVGFQTVTGFADAYPIHLLNLASVQDVAARCAADIPKLSIRRFRANIIVQGPAAFEEDHWKRIRVACASSEDDGQQAAVDIFTVCRTVRCRLPNVDPDTGVRHPSEPDRTLKSYRKIDPGDFTNSCLGMQLVPAVQREYSLRPFPVHFC